MLGAGVRWCRASCLSVGSVGWFWRPLQQGLTDPSLFLRRCWTLPDLRAWRTWTSRTLPSTAGHGEGENNPEILGPRTGIIQRVFELLFGKAQLYIIILCKILPLLPAKLSRHTSCGRDRIQQQLEAANKAVEDRAAGDLVAPTCSSSLGCTRSRDLFQNAPPGLIIVSSCPIEFHNWYNYLSS